MKIDASDMFEKMTSHGAKVVQAVHLYGETAGKKLEGQAKKAARWTDRTGRARGTITGGAEKEGNNVKIFLSGNMIYSKYLELPEYMGDRFAVLEPTIEANKRAILEGLQKVLLK